MSHSLQFIARCLLKCLIHVQKTSENGQYCQYCQYLSPCFLSQQHFSIAIPPTFQNMCIVGVSLMLLICFFDWGPKNDPAAKFQQTGYFEILMSVFLSGPNQKSYKIRPIINMCFENVKKKYWKPRRSRFRMKIGRFWPFSEVFWTYII